MDVQQFKIDTATARTALAEYKQHRDTHDSRDWEIERIYRAITKGKIVLDVKNAIATAGLLSDGLPKLAFGQAHKDFVFCTSFDGRLEFSHDRWRKAPSWGIIPLPGAKSLSQGGKAVTPRIPPQHRPAQAALKNYHILWEANWTSVPSDPYLLRRIGLTDIFIVLAEWDLTDVEIAVMRSHLGRRPS